jgi:hypothetical protein
MGRCSGHKTVAEAKKCLNAAEDYVVAIENGQIRAITKKEEAGEKTSRIRGIHSFIIAC